ncbi:MAG TPA: V-type ATPase 116kDa subunit family protein, partial [Thermodesulfovibrionales bacterium]|nr:V-type ATPase 116kDa subunit family protein [Thermodesulfovibrionales bacterium]
SFLLDEKTLAERLFIEDLVLRIDELFSYLPKVLVRTSYIEPIAIIDTIAKTLERHVTACRELYEKKEALEKENGELGRYAVFLGALASLLESTGETPDLDFIGFTIREPDMVGRIRQLLSQITDWRYELVTENAEDGTLVGLITIEKSIAERVKKSLSDEHIPELSFPPSFSGLTFPEKITYVKKRSSLLSAEIEAIGKEMERFSRRWVPIYQRMKDWAVERLSLLRTTASVFETRMCFFIYGWMPADAVRNLRRRLLDAFQGKAALVEKEIREEDLDRVPIVLKNPPYFKPFELLVKLLPLPKYSSFDPTPFIGIFFPIFFGMILGDAGYGVILLAFSVFMVKRFTRRKEIHDASKIMLISSLYAIVFGVLYGEYFGELGARFFGLEPLFLERRTAVMPMIYLALSVGLVHTTLGLFLGFLSALRKKTTKEAVYKLLAMLTILLIVVLIASFFKVVPELLTQPVVIAILVLTPFLFFAGGILAPLELLKSIGNIISYVRIMAIGLTSVLLALVANSLGGMTGDIVVGVVAGTLLHFINLILGVFSPTIHSLRLHYVEFFSKFLEHGGKRFEPLRK